MTPAALRQKLTDLIATWENEVVEFKEASNSYSTGDIGKYFSALSNEANLKDVDAGWLVFGVNNKSRTVVGTDYRPAPAHLQSLKQQIAEGADPTTTFRQIHEVDVDGKRVVMLEIPPRQGVFPLRGRGRPMRGQGKA